MTNTFRDEGLGDDKYIQELHIKDAFPSYVMPEIFYQASTLSLFLLSLCFRLFRGVYNGAALQLFHPHPLPSRGKEKKSRGTLSFVIPKIFNQTSTSFVIPEIFYRESIFLNTYGPRLKDCRGDGLEVIETFRGDILFSSCLKSFIRHPCFCFFFLSLCFFPFLKGL